MDCEDLILLVEDNSDDACILAIALRKAGISSRLEILNNPVEALRYLSGEAPYSNRAVYPMPALVLVSAELRLVSGLEVLRWVGRQPQLRGLPLVLLLDFPLSEPALAGLPRLARTVVKPGGFSELVGYMMSMRHLLPSAAVPAMGWRQAG